MKRFLTSALLLTLAVSFSGCAYNCYDCNRAKSKLRSRPAVSEASCPPGGGRLFGGLFGGGAGAGGGYGGGGIHGGYPPGPPTPAVAYPYYTTRAPRDFLSPNPRGIGP